jgi:hypothetical protein
MPRFLVAIVVPPFHSVAKSLTTHGVAASARDPAQSARRHGVGPVPFCEINLAAHAAGDIL